MATTGGTRTRIGLGALLAGAVTLVLGLFRRKRKPRSIELGNVSQSWLASKRGLREDRF
jgi:hypothetical protein